MLYYSEKSKQFYKTEEALKAAEADYDKKQTAIELRASEKKSRAKAIEEAYQHAQEVRKKASEMIQAADQEYYNLRNKFVEDYGSFHMSYSNNDATVDDVLIELGNALARWPW